MAPMKKLFFLLVPVLMMLASCSTPPKDAPDINKLYMDIASSEDPLRNPVIVIPGLLGSRLYDEETKRIVWGEFGEGQIDPDDPVDARLIALPMEMGKPLSALQDDVVNAGTADQVVYKVFGISFFFDTYTNILNALGVGGYRDRERGKAGLVDYGGEHFTCFQFDYDWRRDVVETAKQLDVSLKFLQGVVRKEVEQRYGLKDHPVRFNIVAHSMGGLVARYYLMYGAADLPEDGSLPPLTWAGAELVENIIVVGTPNAGSAQAFQDLLQGSEVDPALPFFPPALTGTMPSIYQLMPRTRHARVINADGKAADIYDTDLWVENGWGLADPQQDTYLSLLLPQAGSRQERKAIAIDHLNKSLNRAQQFHAALDRSDAVLPDHVGLLLIAGDAQDTIDTLTLDSNNRIAATGFAPGDGTVTRSSALLDERLGLGKTTRRENPRLISPIEWEQVLFLFSDHITITKDPAFTDNLLFYLLERQKKDAPPLNPEHQSAHSAPAEAPKSN